jgi:hypothetical protein
MKKWHQEQVNPWKKSSGRAGAHYWKKTTLKRGDIQIPTRHNRGTTNFLQQLVNLNQSNTRFDKGTTITNKKVG